MANEATTVLEETPQKPRARRPFVASEDVPAFKTELVAALAEQGLPLSTSQVAALASHYCLLGEANNQFNLTRLIAPAEAVRWHYLDILAALPYLTALAVEGTNGKLVRWVDVGSGGGFPGLVLAVACPNWHFILAERRAKKAAFLQHCVEELALGRRVQVFAGDFEPGTVNRALKLCNVDVSRETLGLLGRAVEDGQRKLPRLLAVPVFVRAAFWLGRGDAQSLAKHLPPKWKIQQQHLLPTGNCRTVIVLVRE
jgi:16S rRNA (guanine527-N7)-methyltransferase